MKNYPVTTLKSYCSDLLSFFYFLKEYFSIDTEVKDFNEFILLGVKESDIYAFLVYLNYNKDNMASTRKRKLTSIRMFYNWLISHYPKSNILNPAKDIPSIEEVVRLPKYLTLEQSKKIINIFNKSNSRHPLRDNTIIFLFLNTGIRISELSNINIRNINLDKKYIEIIAKGNKLRKVFINEITKKYLTAYLLERNKGLSYIDINAPLFLNQRNKRLGIDGISDICKKAFKLAGLEEFSYTPHSLRHTSATLMYQYSTNDIMVIKEFLGHQSVTTTQIYTHIHSNSIKKAVDSNPLNEIAM